VLVEGTSHIYKRKVNTCISPGITKKAFMKQVSVLIIGTCIREILSQSHIHAPFNVNMTQSHTGRAGGEIIFIFSDYAAHTERNTTYFSFYSWKNAH